MENIQQKVDFLKNDFTQLLSQLDADAPRLWGKMNVQQMIEHMSDSMRVASGKLHTPVLTPAESLDKMQAFLFSEKPFRGNTLNPLIPETPPAVKHATKQEAINELQQEIDHFFAAYDADATLTAANPFFGVLGYEQQVQLLYKHATHHLKQFGVDIHQE